MGGGFSMSSADSSIMLTDYVVKGNNGKVRKVLKRIFATSAGDLWVSSIVHTSYLASCRSLHLDLLSLGSWFMNRACVIDADR